MDVLQVKNLSKRFGGITAVDNISFSLKEGEILGLLGRNGAGKTTTIQMLLGVLTPTLGSVNYFGMDLRDHREEILEKVNFSSTYTNLPWDLTVKENLTYISYLYAINDRNGRIKKITRIFKLDDVFNKQIRDLSAGQITRVNLAKALLNYPKVLLLDEPTASLDPDVAKYIREFLLEQRKQFNVSIVLTSHNMAEVEEVCDRVVFIEGGKIVADNTPDQLAKTIRISHVELIVKDGLKRTVDYCRNKNIRCHVKGRYIVADIEELNIPDFLRELMGIGVYYDEISIEKPTLEDYFLQVTYKKE